MTKKIIPRPGRKIQAIKRHCARAQLLEMWREGYADKVHPRMRLAIETLVPELHQKEKILE